MKKSLSVLVSAAVGLSLLSSTFPVSAAPQTAADFHDLNSLDAAQRAKFDAMISAGIFNGVGDGVFGLNDKMNRAQFAKVAALIFGLKVDTTVTTSSFIDVQASDPANGYALPYIEALRAAHLTDGFGQGTYNPAGEVTKEQLAAFLIRGLGKDAGAQAAAGPADSTVSSWAQGYAKLALQLNLMGSQPDGTFGGMQPATRQLLVTSAYETQRVYVPGASGNATGGSSAAPGVLQPAELPTYTLTGNARTQIKSILQEKTSEGWRIGAAIKVFNDSGSTIRIPDYELRIKTADGMIYTLQPSAGNAPSIPPQGHVTLNYMTSINLRTDIRLTNVLWMDVNREVYPKQETLLADAPVESIVWRGQDAVITDPARIGAWGAVFSLPGIPSALQYSATSLTTQFAGQIPTHIVQLKVQNTGSYAETIPDFILSGRADGQTFTGKRVESETATVNAGEQKYIHFAITTDPGVKLNSFYVLTPESYLAQGQAAPLTYYTGQIGFQAPAVTSSAGTSGGRYTLGTPMVFDPLTHFINPDLDVALEELHVTPNEETGGRTGLAKFKLTNQGDQPIPMPAFQVELTGKAGSAYAGNRQTVGSQDIAPGTARVVSYSFNLPSTDDSESYRMNVQQVLPGQGTSAGSGTAYKSTLASYSVDVQKNEGHNEISLYPFTLNMKSWVLSQLTTTGASGFNYTYRLNLDLDLQREANVELDASFSKLKFELVDALGRSLGSSTFPFTGTNRLVSGTQVLSFTNLAQHQIQNQITVKVYEVVSTPTGDVERFLTELK